MDVSDEALKIAGTMLGIALMFLIKNLFKENSEKKIEVFQTGVRVAYNMVNEVAKLTANTIDDKAALGLKYLSEYLEANNVKMTPALQSQAAMIFKAMHGEEKTAAELAAPASPQ